MGDRDRRDDDDRPVTDSTPPVIGSVVILNSGGPRMTVIGMDALTITATGISSDGKVFTVTQPTIAFTKIRSTTR